MADRLNTNLEIAVYLTALTWLSRIELYPVYGITSVKILKFLGPSQKVLIITTLTVI